VFIDPNPELWVKVGPLKIPLVISCDQYCGSIFQKLAFTDLRTVFRIKVFQKPIQETNVEAYHYQVHCQGQRKLNIVSIVKGQYTLRNSC
jgi:hypothetical protein